MAIENASGETVATLVRDLPVGRYKTLSLRWNGRRGIAHGYGVLRLADGYRTLLPRNRGAVAPAGEYTVRVNLRNEDRVGAIAADVQAGGPVSAAEHCPVPGHARRALIATPAQRRRAGGGRRWRAGGDRGLALAMRRDHARVSRCWP